MKLSHDWPQRLPEAARERIQMALDTGCNGLTDYNVRCAGTSASLVRRMIAGGTIQVLMQCDVCGKSLGGAHKRELHPNWASYPEWDRDLVAAQTAAWEERHRIAREEYDAKVHPEWIIRTEEYAQFLLSPIWRDMRARVLDRDGHRCQACLEARATEVHHTTYSFGKLPPAWCLFAVCARCHARLHEGWEPKRQ